MSKPTATASGTLESTPLANLLVYAVDKRLTGTMIFEPPGGGRSALYFHEGAPAKAKTSDPVVHLGRLLLELGAIGEDDFNRTLARCAKERRLHGQILVEEEVIDQAILDDALREQLMRKVLWLFTLPPATVYAFYEGHNFLEKYGAPELVTLEPLSLIWRGVRNHEDARRIEATLARVAGRDLRLHAQAQLSRFCFASRDWGVLDVIRGRPQPLAQLLASGVSDDVTIKRMVYALAITRSLDLGAGTRPVGIQAGAPASSNRARQTGKATRPRPVSPPKAANRSSPQAAPPPPPVRSSPQAAPPPEEVSIRDRATPVAEPPPRRSSPVAAPPPQRSSPVAAPPPVRSSPVAAPPPQRSSPVAAPSRAVAAAAAPQPLPPIGTPATPPSAPSAVRRAPPTRPSDPAPSSVRTLRSVTPDPGQDRHSGLPSITMPPSHPTNPTPEPAADRSSIPPTTDVVLLEIRERAEKAPSQNYYQLLGVGQGSATAQISAAFFKLAKRFHPDRLGIDDAEVKAQAVSLFARMNEAHQVLTDDERRAEYDAVLDEGGGTAEEQEQVQAVVRAITEFQKAEVFYKKGQMDLAEAAAKSAMQDDPEQADYVALYATVAAQRRGDGRMDDLIDLLDGAIRRDPKTERARFARGQIYKRMNRNDLAIKDFRWVAQQNPRNLEATREVRLYNMRKGGPSSQRPSAGPKSGKEGSSGFFGKFFKR